jgi:hypothetical protein
MNRAVILLILSFSFFAVNAQQERKFLIWNYNSISVDITNKTSILASEKVHYTPFESGLDLKFGDLWVKHKTCNWFEYSGGFRVLYSRNDIGWIEERRPMVMGTFSKKIRNFGVSFSQRLEYRFYELIEDHFRYRQKIDIESPSLTSFGLQFFAAEETYTKFNNDRTHLARLYAGIQTIDKEHFAMKVYYVLEKNKKDFIWNTADVLSMNLSFSL